MRLANQFEQKGWISNTSAGVTIAIEGLANQQLGFIDSLYEQLPFSAEIKKCSISSHALVGFVDFQIRPSTDDGKLSAFVLPDIAICENCIRDIFNPDNRFYRYPFTSCSFCGPRYSIMRRQPYDRTNTSLSTFSLCSDCLADYHSISNRRYHAQTIACPKCGPQLKLLDSSGRLIASQQLALNDAYNALKNGKIVAIKSIGGFQLLVDASNLEAVKRLRAVKNRPYQPFAIMVRDLLMAQQLAIIDQQEQKALLSPIAPIVLLKQLPSQNKFPLLSAAVTLGNPLIGTMLPYSPLHHLLLNEFTRPVVATSGNLHNDPICTDDSQALLNLNGIADFYLTHNRPILRPLDDSIVRIINNKATVIRRARGYVPSPIQLPVSISDTLAVGGHLKNTVAISIDNQAIISQHLGNLVNQTNRQLAEQTCENLQQFYSTKATRIMCDMHPDYGSSLKITNKIAVQHHYAHALSCMAEHGLKPDVLAVCWDGIGLGHDHQLWGGEFLIIHNLGFDRYAHLRPFFLPGADKAIEEPRRAALGLLYELYGTNVFNKANLPFSDIELNLLKFILKNSVNCSQTTSIGRLFDAVASLLGLCQVNQYEGQAAIMLENETVESNEFYPFKLTHQQPIIIDWQPTILALLKDIENNSMVLCASKFHNTLANIIVSIAQQAGQVKLVLSGGCFQNAYLTSTVCQKLTDSGFTVYCHEKIPPNDGGLALGQLYAAHFRGNH